MKIKYSKVRNVFDRAFFALYRVYVWLGLKREKKFWGVVYDAKTKEPLDPVILKLVSLNGGGELQTSITDLKGRYGFLANPGKYKILAMRSNYLFPSKIVSGDSDGSFTNIYHGEFFEIIGDSEVVAPNIPMDPLGDDWNQEAKKKMFNTFWQKAFSFFSFVGIFCFWFGFIFVSSKVLLEVKTTNEIIFTKSVNLFFVYIFVFMISIIIPKGRLWGQVLSAESKNPLTNIQLEIINPLIKDSVMAKTIVWNDGKYFLRINPGVYELIFKSTKAAGEIRELGRVKIKVGSRSLVNETFYLKH